MEPGTIRVGNKRKSSDFKPEIDEVVINIDRPHLLCNHFPISAKNCRETCLLAFKIDFELEMKRRSGVRYDEVCRIMDLLLDGKDVILMCWCKPLACHGDTIKEAVEQLLRAPKYRKPDRRGFWR